jgi:hypothetical protein
MPIGSIGVLGSVFSESLARRCVLALACMMGLMWDDCYVHWKDVDIPLSFGVVTAVSSFSALSVRLTSNIKMFAGKPQLHHFQPYHSTHDYQSQFDGICAIDLD